MSDSCPECGATFVNAGWYCNVDGKLSNLTVSETIDEYYKNPEKYDNRYATMYECGNVVITDD